MSRHHYIIALGSNWEAEKNVEYAIEKLKNKFKDIRFSALQKTVPIGMPNNYMFTNCVVSIGSNKEFDEINLFLKDLERECGRAPEDKSKGIIKLDLDIIMIDEITHKEEDLKRAYIINGLNEINNSMIQKK